MGCSVGKLDSRKLKNSSFIEVDDIKIQTVLQLNEKKPRKGGKTPLKSGRNHRHKRGDSRNRRQVPSTDVTRHKSPRHSKPAYDSKISAKYDIKAVIGKGSFSKVLRVEHRISKQPYALKTIDATDRRESFDAELGVLRRLNHPNVIKLIEVFESESKLYMVMELATGGSLLDRLEAKGNLTDDDSKDLVRMVLEGVKYLHLLGITHRDLKPDNLLYYHPGKDSKIMITDFSFASTRKPTGNPYMHTVCGTPQYIAPEIVLRRPYTSKVDMWAVGVITYIVLSGAFPFDAEQDAQIFKLILKGEVNMTDSVWSNVSDEAKALVRLLLQTDPSLRPAPGSALAHAWFCSTAPPTYSPVSGGSVRSGRSSTGSSRGSGRSLRVSGRVRGEQLEALSSDPDVAAWM